MGSHSACRVAAATGLLFVASGCFESQRAWGTGDAASRPAPADAGLRGDASTPDERGDDGRDAGAGDAGATDVHGDDAGAAGSVTTEPDAGAVDLAVVSAFEQALTVNCTCRGGTACDEAWNDQFDGASKACVAQALEEAEVRDCAEQGVHELTACLLGTDCTQCDGALLTDDTPLGDLVQEHCPSERASAYFELLLASGLCKRTTRP